MKQQHGVLVPTCEKLSVGILHQQSMAIVNGIAQLEGIHGIRVTLLELNSQLKEDYVRTQIKLS